VPGLRWTASGDSGGFADASVGGDVFQTQMRAARPTTQGALREVLGD
jgi:hypothetical protein